MNDEFSTRFPHVVIRASAGTGKTFRLAHRYLALMLAGEPPDDCLAATFARKAAGEIVDRILLRLAEAIESDNIRADFAQHIDRSNLSTVECTNLLRKLLQRLHRLRIGTLDSFFVQLAGHFALELGLPLGWKIIDDVDDRRLIDEAVQQVLGSESVSDVATLVGLMFKGESKRNISDEVRSIVADLYELYRITKHDAWHRLPRATRLDEAQLIAAIDSLATLPPLGDKRMTDGWKGDCERALSRDWRAFIDKGLAKKIISGEPKYYNKPIPAEAIAAYEPLLDEARAEIINSLANQTEATYRLLEKYDRAIRGLKQERRTLRFDDVTRELAAGLYDGEIASIAFRLDGHVAHLLLDEFQDTSLSQWSVVRPFAQHVTNEPGRHSFFCVGDVKQAIYGWRGGVSEIFDYLRVQLPGISEASLTTSYRSAPVIIDLVNRVGHSLGENSALVDYAATVKVWQQRYEQHTTARDTLQGHARLVVAPELEGATPEQATLSFAAAEIARLAKLHPGRSIGVLVRRNSTVAKLMHLLRSVHQLPASEEGGNPLSDSRAVQLVLSALRLVDHPQDLIARFHVAHSPLGKHLGLVDYRDDQQARHVSRQVRSGLLTDGYGKTLFAWLPALAECCDQRELSRLEQLVELAYGYDSRATLRTADFAELVETHRVEDPNAAPVRVMTVHQAKGLQFDLVVLPELDLKINGRTPRVVVEQRSAADPITAVCRYVNADEQELLPKSFQAMFAAAPQRVVSEALCVLYVALTRPVHAVHLIVHPTGKFSTKQPTYAMLLQAALAPDGAREPGKTLFELGTADWDRADRAPQPAPLPAIAINIRLKPSTEVTRGWERQTPSGMQGGLEVQLAQRMQLDSDRGRLRGSVLHAWFEAISWLDQGAPDDALLDQIARRHGGLSLDLPQLRSEFRAMLDQPIATTLLNSQGYLQATRTTWPAEVQHELVAGASSLEVWRERRFAVLDDDKLLQGSFDRVVVWKQAGRVVAADVIDFKSDRIVDAAALQKTVEYYRPQIDAYRRALVSLLGLEPSRIRARLWFVEAGKGEEIK